MSILKTKRLLHNQKKAPILLGAFEIFILHRALIV